MATLPHIKFRVSSSANGEDGSLKTATFRAVGGTLVEDKNVHKYYADIIMHALSGINGLNDQNERFTYTFPFNLS